MPCVITIPEFVERYADWTAEGLAVQIMALEAMGAIGVNIGAPSYQVVPWFEANP